MPLPRILSRFARDERGTILVFWGVALVVVMGLLALTFDFGRMAATQSELQSYADNVALTAAGELDGRPDAIQRATRAAELISDSQSFGKNGSALSGASDYTLTFYAAVAADGAPRDVITTNPAEAYYIRVVTKPQTIGLGFGAAFAALRGDDATDPSVGASATARFELEACDVTPIQVCMPTVDFRAEANIGKTLDLKAGVGLSLPTPGLYNVTRTLTDQLDGLSLCAGLLGATLDACLLAGKKNRTGCRAGGDFEISADLSLLNLDAALNVKLGQYTGIMAGVSNNANFESAPNVLQGLVSALGICLPNGILPTAGNIGLPKDDCLTAGSCSVLGNGAWVKGRADYIAKHYGGVDPYPAAKTRYEFYKAEIAGQKVTPQTGGLGGLVGGVVGAVAPRLCSPQASKDATRRVMVVAGIDCTGNVSASASVAPVRQFFEVFQLAPSSNGLLSVEIVGCLGGTCGTGETKSDVRDVIRLVN